MRTPYLHVDVARLDANLARVARRADAAGVALRPHAKTHKCVEIARRQLALGAVGLTVATVGEAEVFVGGGCDDVLVAFPLWVDDDRAARLRALAEQATVAIAVDSVEGAAQAGRQLAGSGVEVLVEVDSGHHRTGVRPTAAAEVARATAGLEVRGVLTFPGHSYAPAALRSAALDEAAALAVAADGLRAAGIDVRVVSGARHRAWRRPTWTC